MSDLRAQLQSTLGDGYTLERELGGGGMSRVFVARENALGREVVVKVVAPELSASVSVERFTREIATAARLQQANIVPVLAAGTSGGVPYYTMPFVTGESLRALLARGATMSLHDQLNVLRDVARGLAYAHGEGVIHRDIKPDNILLSGGAAVVIDFGIAKAISAARTQDSAALRADDGTLTQVGSSIGTPAYMAPEQAVGEHVDHRADLYAWGVVAYELLAGQHPFAGKSGTSQLIAAHIAEAPGPLGVRAPEVPRDVAALVMQCLAKNPADRPSGATELLRQLAIVVTPVEGAGHAPAARLARPSSRTPHVRRAAIVAVIAMVAFGAWRIIQRPAAATDTPIAAVTAAGAASTTAPRTLVVLPFASVGGDTANVYFAEGMADELSSALSKVSELQVVGRSSAAAFAGKRMSAQAIGEALQVGAVLEGTVRRAGDRLRVSTQLTDARTGLLLWSETYERAATDIFAVQDDIARAIAGALRVTLTNGATDAATKGPGTDDLEAYELYQRGVYFYQRRGPGLVRAREYLEQAIAKDPRFARAHAVLGLTWIALAIATDVAMIDAIPRVLAEGERAVAIDSASSEGWAAIGVARIYQHRWREADEATQRAVRVDGSNPSAHQYRSRLLLVTGRVDEALTAARRLVELDPMNAVTLGYVALTLSIAGQHAEAMAVANRAWEIDSTVSAVTSYALLALHDGGQVPVAVRRAESVMRAAREPTQISGGVYVIGASGDIARAATLTQQLAVQFARHPRIHSALTVGFLAAGDTAQALTAMERAADRFEIGVVNSPLAHRRYDVLRGSPRFAAIVRKLGLDVALFTSASGGRPR
ncbi:protein kinase domain-containing protein [Gemmatimonas sp.]|uniref:protein kinase domain-containing protein n=1 Tax=Gemmatimonas sp. TaxID=1962908 RepID=UPI0035669BD6